MVLQTLGALIKESIRTEDIGGRYGGEEFLIIMPDTSLQNCVMKAESLKHKLHKDILIEYNGRDLGKITASFGVALFPQYASGGAELISATDQALYRAKKLGRDRVVTAE